MKSASISATLGVLASFILSVSAAMACPAGCPSKAGWCNCIVGNQTLRLKPDQAAEFKTRLDALVKEYKQ